MRLGSCSVTTSGVKKGGDIVECAGFDTLEIAADYVEVFGSGHGALSHEDLRVLVMRMSTVLRKIPTSRVNKAREMGHPSLPAISMG